MIRCFLALYPDDEARGAIGSYVEQLRQRNGSVRWEKAAQIHVVQNVDDIEAVLLCSDGVEDPFYPMETNAIEVFRQIYCGVREPLPDFVQERQGPIIGERHPGDALLKWVGFQKRGENDDRSVLLMHRHPVRQGAWGGGDGAP